MKASTLDPVLPLASAPPLPHCTGTLHPRKGARNAETAPSETNMDIPSPPVPSIQAPDAPGDPADARTSVLRAAGLAGTHLWFPWPLGYIHEILV